MKRRCQKICAGLLLLVCWGCSSGIVWASADNLAEGVLSADENDSAQNIYSNGLDYSNIQAVIDQSDVETPISFSEVIDQLMAGDMMMTFESLGRYIYEKIFYEIGAQKNALLQIIGIALIGAVFTNFSVAFAQNYVAQSGFFVSYILLVTLLLGAFAAASEIAAAVLTTLLDFMAALLPVFCTAIAFSAGMSSASGFYSVMIVAVAAVDWLICQVILRLIQIYLVLSMVDHISGEANMSRMAALLRSIIGWSLKTLVGGTLGLNVIQGLILPAFDSFKSSAMMRISSVIPGIGNALNAAARTAIGSGVLIKNAVGAGGLVIILLICALPLLKLLVISFMYKVTEVVVAPVSDKRILDCIHTAADAITLLLMAVAAAMLLFGLSLAVIASASNLSLGT